MDLSVSALTVDDHVPLAAVLDADVLAGIGIGDVPLFLAQRQAAHDSGTAVYLVLHADGARVGVIGLSGYRTGGVESVTMLSRSVWGTGVNVAVKHAQWELAGMLGARSMLISVLDSNARAEAAVRRLWPQVAARRVFEQWRRRWALVWEVSEPPALPAPAPVAGLWDAVELWRSSRRVTGGRAVDGEIVPV